MLTTFAGNEFLTLHTDLMYCSTCVLSSRQLMADFAESVVENNYSLLAGLSDNVKGCRVLFFMSIVVRSAVLPPIPTPSPVRTCACAFVCLSVWV